VRKRCEESNKHWAGEVKNSRYSRKQASCVIYEKFTLTLAEIGAQKVGG